MLCMFCDKEFVSPSYKRPQWSTTSPVESQLCSDCVVLRNHIHQKTCEYRQHEYVNRPVSVAEWCDEPLVPKPKPVRISKSRQFRQTSRMTAQVVEPEKPTEPTEDEIKKQKELALAKEKYQTELIQKNFRDDLSLYVVLLVERTSNYGRDSPCSRSSSPNVKNRFLIECKFPLLASIKRSKLTNKVYLSDAEEFMYGLDFTSDKGTDQTVTIFCAHVQSTSLRNAKTYLAINSDDRIKTRMESVHGSPVRMIWIDDDDGDDDDDGTDFYYFVGKEFIKS